MILKAAYRFPLELLVREESNVFFLVCHLSASTVAQSNFVLFPCPRCPHIDFHFCQQDRILKCNLMLSPDEHYLLTA